ncbi:MAG: hypothetical protein V7K67_16925 [Nostoc sp.]|uniref:hypothetical protein n=1 Tax=Nostoc sp. TaxID=1180 RepID=UPI002FFC3494
MAKYKDLYRAAELTADYEKLVAWQALSRSAKQALYAQHKKGTARMNLRRVPGYIRIFGSASGLVVIQKRIPSSISQPATEADAEPLVTTLINVVTPERASVVVPNDTGVNILPNIKKFKFAKLSLISVLGQAQATGRVIGVGYTKINTETVSTPFGRGTATETYAAAIAAIKASTAYTGFTNLTPPTGTQATNRIVIYPEVETA